MAIRYGFVCIFFIFALFLNAQCVVFDLIRTAGGHVGSHFFLGLGQTNQYRFLLFDLTETNFWTFADMSGNMSNLVYGSGPFDLSKDNTSLYNISNPSYQIGTSYKIYSEYGYYEAPLDAKMYPIRISSLIYSNGTLRNTTQIAVLPVKDLWYYNLWNSYFFDGVFGIGNGLIGNSQTNWTSGWMNSSSLITINVPGDMATKGQLVVNEDTFPEACEDRGYIMNMSQQVYLRYGDFEFNITGVYGLYNETDYYYYYKTWPATISTMSSFITVDNSTWDYIMQKVNPIFDPYGATRNDIGPPYFRVKCSDAELLQLTISMTAQNGEDVDFKIPGSSLIKPNPYGECFLKVQKNSVDAWVLGTPFLENYCLQFAPQTRQMAVMNLTSSMAYPTVPPPLTYNQQSQLFYNIFGSQG